jgi:hypothetical protein
MKTLIVVFLLLGVSTRLYAQGNGHALDGTQPGNADGILRSIENANVSRVGKDLLVTRKEARTPVEIVFTHCQGLGVQYERKQWWALPISASGAQVNVNRSLWILPLDATSKDHSWHLALHGGDLDAKKTEAGLTVTLHAESATLSQAEARPPSDPSVIDFLLKCRVAQNWKKLWPPSTGEPCCHLL